MCGICVPDDTVPVSKGNNGIVVLNEKEATPPETTACIRCGRCVRACPMGLNPYRLLNLCEAGDKAQEIFAMLSRDYNAEYDDTGSIGKRYRRQDEIGTPFCITVDFDTLEDGAVTIRHRDSMEQERIAISELQNYFSTQFCF